MKGRFLGWALAIAALGTVVLAWTNHERSLAREPAVLFSRTQPGCAIVIPRNATEAERRAAELVQTSLAKAAGRSPAMFPIFSENASASKAAIFIGATRHGHLPGSSPPKAPFDNGVSVTVRAGAVFLRGERREIIESAASWFLERYLGVHWFMPGPLGEYIPPRAELVLPAGDTSSRPGFVSRELAMRAPADTEWQRRNRLESRFTHGHNLVEIFRPADLTRTPEMAPMRLGSRFIPTSVGDYNWQPNMLSRAAVEHAAAVANRAFAADPKRLSFSLSTNDSFRYDDSPETLAAVAPPRFFRHRPDYSNLVFGFTNEVAKLVAARHPDRYLPAYAYYWCENAPDFRVARNIVPFLTAERHLWSNAGFAAEDRALIERWCRSGAEIVGVYDYFYGAPYLIPRPTLYAVKETIPFEYRAGVRAFTAEMFPNWALDGPKPWLTAQLLWSPERNPDELLEIYFREFWAEAASPMREFYRVCDDAWRAMPGPAFWLRFYEDEDQVHLYSAAQFAALRAQVGEAARLATTAVVRARVELLSEALGVSEALVALVVARGELSRLADEATAPAALIAAWKKFRTARVDLMRRYFQVRHDHPAALAPQDVDIYLRNQPDGRVARALVRSEEGRGALRGEPDLPLHATGASLPEIVAGFTRGIECLNDPGWRNFVLRPVGASTAADWIEPGKPWRGAGEPWEGRSLALDDRGGGPRVLRIAGSRAERLGQWAPATANALYIARAKVRAQVSAGNTTLLIVSFLDEQQRHIGSGVIDRVPANATAQDMELCVITRAPANAKWVGFGLHVLNQVNDDFAEFSDASLRQWSEP